MSKIHLISIGGAVMHNIGLALNKAGHQVSGSDDEIYEPSRTRLANAGILPEKMGWDASRITPDLDYIILGMHAKFDNPEILKAQELGIKIYSFPEFIYKVSMNKKRVVVGGSQGKTTTTSMIMWVLKKMEMDFDYLVGALIKGFELMVKFSDAPVIVIEGDEYLSSPLDRTPKIHHYHANIGLLTGIDWDHMNVFPTYDIYKEQFIKYLESMEEGGTLIYFHNDEKIHDVISKASNSQKLKLIPYTYVEENKLKSLKIFGDHNRANLHGALKACLELGISEDDFWRCISDFEGADKRLQKLFENEKTVKFLDFAHAPAKVKATVNAVRQQYPDRKLYAFYELHTFSSLNKDFLPQYHGTLMNCDHAVIVYSRHTLEMKDMPMLSKEEVIKNFGRDDLQVFDNYNEFRDFISGLDQENAVFLFMSSGNFGGINLKNND
ncbi:MAG: UDP-N-acetylmuramate--L-alanine ligase [Deltaproteobacteria bacterium]